MGEETSLEVLQQKKQSLEEIIGQEDIQKIKKVERRGRLISVLSFSAFAYPLLKYVVLPTMRYLAGASTPLKGEDYIALGSAVFGGILLGEFVGKDIAKDRELKRINPEKAKKIREWSALHYEIKTRSADVKFKKVDRVLTKASAYGWRAATYVTGIMETMVGSAIAHARISYIINNPPQTDANLVGYGAMSALAVLGGIGAITDGIYTLIKGERPMHLLLTGLEKIKKPFRVKEIAPKYSDLIKKEYWEN
jgi:hypothetical protein